MSGGPPHHPHSRQAPASNNAWNHLQVPNYFPSRQPQHAHMSNEHPLLHQSTWHTPTTEPMKALSHSHLFNLEQMLTERQYSRPTPGVDLTLTRNGSQNGELPTTPISLSVRDTNKINSLPPSALDIQAVELTKSLSPGLKSMSPGLKSMSPGLKASSPGLSSSSALLEKQNSPKNIKRSNKRVDSILERLNPMLDKSADVLDSAPFFPAIAAHEKKETHTEKIADKCNLEKTPQNQSVIVQATGSLHDDNSNSSSILNVPTPGNVREEDVVSPYSNEDSLDSNKSRRKRKPTKTIRVPKEDERGEPDPLKLPAEFPIPVAENRLEIPVAAISVAPTEQIEDKPEKKLPERRRSSGEISDKLPKKTRRKTSSESETIANIAAMVHEGLDEVGTKPEESVAKPVTVSVITSREKTESSALESNENSNTSSTAHSTTLVTPAQRKATNFVEVENKLEEMFAGIEENETDPLSTVEQPKPKCEENDSKMEYTAPSTSQNQDNVTSTSNEPSSPHKNLKKSAKGPKRKCTKVIDGGLESTPKRKKGNKKAKAKPDVGKAKVTPKKANKKSLNGKQITTKIDAIKDIYAYDSGSNASSTKSRGPFIQIKGPRDSPIAVNIINTPTNEDDVEKKTNKSKKFHDDSEYRYKVRSKGLHCSTLSNKYDAQTRDVSWICVFCKRGPHATEPNTTGPSLFNCLIPPPGDLFGPYAIGNKCTEFERRLDDPYDKQFISKKQFRALEASTSACKTTGKKAKRKHNDSEQRTDESDVYLGITETADSTYEIWVHEDCIVWSPGIHLIGPKILGLEEAVWSSCNVSCIKCNFKGANICCLRRGCTNVVHFGCAKASDWQLDNDKSFCTVHKQHV